MARNLFFVTAVMLALEQGIATRRTQTAARTLPEHDVTKPSQVKALVKEPGCPKHKVLFNLLEMHSYFTLPTCSSKLKSAGNGNVFPDLGTCGPCDDSGGRADIHWNIPGCQKSMCQWKHDSRVQEESIGPEEGLAVHPVCAWGIVEEMKSVYKPPFRAPGLAGAMAALGWNATNPLNWGKALSAWWDGDSQRLANDAARMVSWKRRLDPSCGGAREKDDVLRLPVEDQEGKTHPLMGVCWNNVIDFRDIWCHYKSVMDVNDPSACLLEFYPRLNPLFYGGPDIPLDVSTAFGGQRAITVDRQVYHCCCRTSKGTGAVSCKMDTERAGRGRLQHRNVCATSKAGYQSWLDIESPQRFWVPEMKPDLVSGPKCHVSYRLLLQLPKGVWRHFMQHAKAP